MDSRQTAVSQPHCAAPPAQVTGAQKDVYGLYRKAGLGELQGNRGDIQRIGFSGIAHEKASVTTPGFPIHCKGFFLGNYLLKQGPKGTFALCEPALTGSHSMGFASN